MSTKIVSIAIILALIASVIASPGQQNGDSQERPPPPPPGGNQRGSSSSSSLRGGFESKLTANLGGNRGASCRDGPPTTTAASK